MKETYPLQWPEGWPRTALRDREERKGWKKTERQAIADLELELKRFNVISSVITRKDPGDVRGADDPSVAVYFSRKTEEDFSWQKALQIDNPAPTIEEIDAAFRKIALIHHPDRGGDLALFHAYQEHKKKAIAYVKRITGLTHDLVIGCDKYKEARWNIFAISNTVYSWRQMERDGASVLLERTMKGFAALPAEVANAHSAA